MNRDNYQFEGFLKEQTALVYGADWSGEVDEYWVIQAQYMQGLAVTDAVRDAFFQSVALSSLLKAPKALYYIRYGVGRRLQMIWNAHRNLVYSASPERKEPLSSGESADITEDINIIYLNIRGTLDNMCWALLHEHAPEKAEKLPPSKVGLFLKGCVKDDKRFEDIREVVSERDSWDRDLKQRRDPAAHGIPLAVPPQLVTPDEAEKYNELMGKHAAAAEALDFDGADAIMKRMDGLGRFVPWFIHDPDQPPMPIHPTVSDDLGHLVVLFRAVDKFFVERSC